MLKKSVFQRTLPEKIEILEIKDLKADHEEVSIWTLGKACEYKIDTLDRITNLLRP